jgi:Tol biopolymer transport system component
VEPDEGHGYDEVVVVDPGRAPVTLRANAADSPTWAPDDRRLALMENYRGDGGGTICVAEVGRVCRDLSHDPPLGPYVEDSPTWSPNGRWIAYARGKLGPRGVELKLFMIHPDGTGRRRLTARSIENPSWSPDGHRIAFDDGRDIYVLNIDGSGTRRLTHAKAIETDPAWSPDGSQIAFQRARSSGSNRSDVWVADARGAHARLLIRNAQQPAWKGG